MIRVLQFADTVNRHDFIDTIVQRADTERFQIGVCVRSNDSNIAPPFYTDRTPRWLLSGTSRRTVPGTVLRLARLLRTWKAEVLHTHHYDQAVIGWLATRLCPGTRLVVGRHYSDAIYRLTSRPKQRALLVLEQAVNRAASRIIVPSAYIQEILVKRQQVSARKIDRVPYGFAVEKYALPGQDEVQRIREELGLKGHFVIGNFSRLHEEKGHRYLLEAMASLRQQLPQLKMLVVGEGAERASLDRQIGALGLGNVVQLLGWRGDAMTLMAAVDAVVQSTLQEAFSQVMVEALWMRKPLVITDVSGAPDIIRDGENGLLVPKADAMAIAGAIRRLADDPHLGPRLGRAGRAYVETNLSIETIIPRYEKAYCQAMEA